MAKWFKEHLGFKTTKAPPPAPPKPDYRHCHATVPGGTTGYLQPSSGASTHYPSPAQPDILAAYKLQKELDFEDPYTGGGNLAFQTGGSSSVVGGTPDIKYVSPKHRLIKVETAEKTSGSPVNSVSGAPTGNVSVSSVKSPTSPPPAHDGKQEKVRADCFPSVQVAGSRSLNSLPLKTSHLDT